jgi:hypothetical protein
VILADTSAWIEHDRAAGSAVNRRLTELISDQAALGVTEPVIIEVLAGARSDEGGPTCAGSSCASTSSGSTPSAISTGRPRFTGRPVGLGSRPEGWSTA